MQMVSLNFELNATKFLCKDEFSKLMRKNIHRLYGPFEKKLPSCKILIRERKNFFHLATFFHFFPARNETLFNYDSIISMCSLESTRLRSPPQFKDLCETKGPAHCCPGWSLGGYIGIMNNRSSCFNIRVNPLAPSIFELLVLF